jgi:uncharacterized protein YkwD
MPKRRTTTLAITLVAALAVTIAPAVGVGQSSGTEAAINPNSRASVTAAYLNQLVPALATTTKWTGSVEGCKAGKISASSQKATKTAVNFMRGLAGLSPVSWSAAYSKKAQAAALVYDANDSLSHDIPKSWTCSTAAARTAGAHSNIAYGWTSTGGESPVAGAKAITGYMEDAGASNTLVGHRRWILNPSAKTFGSGSTLNSQALYVIGKTTSSSKNPTWVEWPTAGYFPQQLEPSGRWSLTANSAFNVSFKNAKITVKNSAGKKLKISKVYKEADGYANDTVVWKVKGVKKATGSKVKTYTVKVSGIKKAGKTVSYSYKVKLFDPTK